MNQHGKFISIEGIEGAGKSTVMPVVAQFLAEKNIPFVKTREPGGTFVAEKIRDVLLSCQDEVVDPRTELFLIFAARIQHVNQVILPALRSGKWVISDRFVDASYAYQGGGRQMPIDVIEYIDQLSLQGLKTDITFFLDAPVELCLQRARSRGELDRIEQEKTDFFTRARDVYLQRAKAESQRIKMIDVKQSVTEVQQAVIYQLDKFMHAT